MFVRLPTALVAASALFTVASAQLKVLSPGGSDEWWVSQSENLLVWNCNESQEQTFTVRLANANMPSPLAIIAQQPNYVCSLLVDKDKVNLPVGTGYTVQLCDPLNNTNVYAESQQFEIKAAGSAYPTSTVSPESATFTPSSSGSASASATAGASTNNNGASSLTVSLGYGVAFVGAVFGLFAL